MNLFCGDNNYLLNTTETHVEFIAKRANVIPYKTYVSDFSYVET